MTWRSGYSVIEVLISLALFAVVITAVFSTLDGQRAFYSGHSRTASARDAARLAVSVLATELRGASTRGGDIYAMGRDSVSLRSTVGLAVVCGSAGGALTLRLIFGSFSAGSSDSLMAFIENGVGVADDSWVAMRVRRLSYKKPRGICPDGRTPDLEVSVGQLDGLAAGSPLRAFRPVTYRLYESRGRWWLGQRPGVGSIQPIAGPFRAPDLAGMRLAFFDEHGSRTVDPMDISLVRIAFVAVAGGGVMRREAKSAVDSASTLVHLRNR